jgi:hypothetical protein
MPTIKINFSNKFVALVLTIFSQSSLASNDISNQETDTNDKNACSEIFSTQPTGYPPESRERRAESERTEDIPDILKSQDIEFISETCERLKSDILIERSRISRGKVPIQHFPYQIRLEALSIAEKYGYEKRLPYFKCLSNSELRSAHVGFVGGMAYNHAGHSIDTADSLYIFVIGMDGELYIERPVKSKFHHSSFFSGGQVLGAGEIKIQNGVITLFTNRSGHYRPNQQQFSRMVLRLLEMGATFKDSAIVPYTNLPKDPIVRSTFLIL